MSRRCWIAVVILGLATSVHAQAPKSPNAPTPEGIEFFEKKIRPVLVENCYSCHSIQAKKTRGGLRLDTREATLKGGDTGPALVAGNPKNSLVVKALGYGDPDLKMPPKGKLPAEAIADFTKWIAMGAPDPRGGKVDAANSGSWDTKKDFWSYKPVQAPKIPMVADAAWPVGDVDRLLLAKFEAKGLRPAADADRATLMRRTTFALIGLPPTPAEIDAFTKDASPDAFAKVVDRLLESPQFGERWGRFWLDIARYADSTGGGRSLLFKDAWRYRDYVIRAFNSDKPFDRFLTEQLAGDLLEAKTPEERRELLIATAFLLLGAINYEEQDKPMLEMDIVDEQIEAIGRGVLGQTIGCARCHDHKFDPISAKDYYALAGILKSTQVVKHDNVSAWNMVDLPVEAKEAQILAKQDAAVAALKRQIAERKAADAKAGKSNVAAGPIDPTTLEGIVVDDVDAKVVGPWKHSTYAKRFVGKGYLFDDATSKVDKTITFQPEFPKSGRYEVRLAYEQGTNRASKVAVRIFHTDGDDTIYVDQKKDPDIDGRFVSLGKFHFAKGNQWFVMLSTEGANGLVVADAVQFIPEDTLASAEPSKAPTLKRLEEDLRRLAASGPQKPRAMGVAEKEKAADAWVCIRGIVHNKGAVVPRGFLSVVPLSADPKLKIAANESGRRQLAAWLTSPANPLTARVAVNRIWYHLFGEGIVRTVDNFGTTGELPSNPELLDHLASRFVAEGWSMKKMIRELILSHAYRMSSVASDEAAKADPENRLFSHQNRIRLDAEALRDGILAISGKLDKTMFGSNMANTAVRERDHVYDDTRRGVYTPVLRNKLLELYEVFDFANPNVCTGHRTASTVPTQSLFLMNSPFIMDQAKAAAARTMAAKNLDDSAKLDLVYRSSLGRLPSERERALVVEYLGKTPMSDRAKAWEAVHQSLFACIDFRYVE
jgi:cytochrome c553